MNFSSVINRVWWTLVKFLMNFGTFVRTLKFQNSSKILSVYLIFGRHLKKLVPASVIGQLPIFFSWPNNLFKGLLTFHNCTISWHLWKKNATLGIISLNRLLFKKGFIQQGPKVRWGPIVVSVKDYCSQKQRKILVKSLEPTNVLFLLHKTGKFCPLCKNWEQPWLIFARQNCENIFFFA